MFGLGHKVFGGGPRTHRQEIGSGRGAGGPDHVPGPSSGLAAGTMVATAMGWRPAEAIERGDLVLTFDRGMQPVKAVISDLAWVALEECIPPLWPLAVPAGALGNARPMLLLPDQMVMLESDTAESVYGDPFTLVRAADLNGFRGIARVQPRGPVETIELQFEHDEVVFADNGGLVFCDSGSVVTVDDLMRGYVPESYRSLDSEEARYLIQCLQVEDSVSTGYDPVARPAGGPYAAFA